MVKMTSKKPYIIEGIYKWIVDNKLTPYLLVNANYPEVAVPEKYVVDGKIVLNISPHACRGLYIDLDRIVFTTTFEGIAEQIFVPPMAVLAIYAKENGEGEFFNEDEEEPLPPEPSKTKGRAGKRPSLKIVK